MSKRITPSKRSKKSNKSAHSAKYDLLDRIKHRHEEACHAHPIIVNGLQERFGFRSRPVTVRWAMRGEDEDTGRARVWVVLGEGLDDMEVLGLSFPMHDD